MITAFPKPGTLYEINDIVLLKLRDNSSPKNEILLSFTHAHAVPNLYEDILKVNWVLTTTEESVLNYMRVCQ